jgi:hypothetical protein
VEEAILLDFAGGARFVFWVKKITNIERWHYGNWGWEIVGFGRSAAANRATGAARILEGMRAAWGSVEG